MFLRFRITLEKFIEMATIGLEFHDVLLSNETIKTHCPIQIYKPKRQYVTLTYKLFAEKGYDIETT